MKIRPFLTIFLSATSILGCLVLPGCGRKAEVIGGPDTVVVKFIDAALAGDADAAFKLLDRESQAEVGDRSQLVEGFSESIDSYSVGHPEISGDKARVPVTLKLKALDPELKFDMVLARDEGSWRISLRQTEAEMEKALEEFFREVQPPG